MDHFRRKQNFPLDGGTPSREADGRMPQIRANAAGGESVGEDQLLSALTLKEAMDRLEEELQEMIFLRYVNDLSAAQIGKILGISRFAVHRRLKRGLDQLRKSLRKEDFL